MAIFTYIKCRLCILVNVEVKLKAEEYTNPLDSDAQNQIWSDSQMQLLGGWAPSGCQLSLLLIIEVSHEKNPLTFHYTGWLIGILIMVYNNPCITG